MPDEFAPASARLASGVLFCDDDGRTLLVKPIYKRGWDLPGGYVEPGESPRRAAEREVAEELGISCKPGRLLVIDWAPHPDDGDKLLFVFDGGTLDPGLVRDIRLQRSELADAQFVRDDQLDELLPERLLHRVRFALAAPTDAYLEHGKPAVD